jgi:hypothetical protein
MFYVFKFEPCLEVETFLKHIMATVFEIEEWVRGDTEWTHRRLFAENLTIRDPSHLIPPFFWRLGIVLEKTTF